MPEAVLCLGKTIDQLLVIVAELLERPEHPVLFTRMNTEQHAALYEIAGVRLTYEPVSRTASLHGSRPAQPGTVAVLTAGTSDLGVAGEAQRTLEFLGINATCIADIGVAGLWRLLERLDHIASFDVLIVVAGMDGALASVVGGLVGQPLIAVPTSTGYGASRSGDTALHSMLASCAQGVLVTNIDNGFGAACAANRILSRVYGPTR